MSQWNQYDKYSNSYHWLFHHVQQQILWRKFKCRKTRCSCVSCESCRWWSIFLDGFWSGFLKNRKMNIFLRELTLDWNLYILFWEELMVVVLMIDDVLLSIIIKNKILDVKNYIKLHIVLKKKYTMWEYNYIYMFFIIYILFCWM